MRHPTRAVPRQLARLLAVVLAAPLMLAAVFVDTAAAHGSTYDPPSRNYGCLLRWQNNHLDPAMQTEDPMCWQAFQSNPAAMWNWNGLYRENVGGNHQAVVPDGQLCSGGRTEGGRYAAMDKIGPWIAKSVSSTIPVTFHDVAHHGADYYRVYVTKQGFDPLNQALGWGNLELVHDTGRIAPSTSDEVKFTVNASGRSGRHIMFIVWQAAHLDQPYYICSDIMFGGGQQTSTSTRTSSTSTWTTTSTTRTSSTSTWTTPTTTTTRQSSSSSTGTGGNGTCSASYSTASSWGSGFVGNVTVSAGNGSISGWKVTINLPSGVSITNAWNGRLSGSSGQVTVTNEGYNGQLGSGQSSSFGFQGSGNPSGTTVSCTPA